jgi:hypothetical protein
MIQRLFENKNNSFKAFLYSSFIAKLATIKYSKIYQNQLILYLVFDWKHINYLKKSVHENILFLLLLLLTTRAQTKSLTTIYLVRHAEKSNWRPN